MLQLLQAKDWIACKPQSDWSKIHTSLVHPKVHPKPIKPIKLALSSCRHSRILESTRFEKLPENWKTETVQWQAQTTGCRKWANSKRNGDVIVNLPSFFVYAYKEKQKRVAGQALNFELRLFPDFIWMRIGTAVC